MDIHFTLAERTVRKLSLVFIYTQAKAVLRDQYNEHTLCTNRVSQFSDWETFTVMQASNIIAGLIDDTLYHQGRY